MTRGTANISIEEYDSLNKIREKHNKIIKDLRSKDTVLTIKNGVYNEDNIHFLTNTEALAILQKTYEAKIKDLEQKYSKVLKDLEKTQSDLIDQLSYEVSIMHIITHTSIFKIRNELEQLVFKGPKYLTRDT